MHPAEQRGTLLCQTAAPGLVATLTAESERVLPVLLLLLSLLLLPVQPNNLSVSSSKHKLQGQNRQLSQSVCCLCCGFCCLCYFHLCNQTTCRSAAASTNWKVNTDSRVRACAACAVASAVSAISTCATKQLAGQQQQAQTCRSTLTAESELVLPVLLLLLSLLLPPVQ